MPEKFIISVGSSRKCVKWKQEEWTWERLVRRLGEAVRTGETAAEYRQFTRDEKSRVKDVGGFVGGCVEGGRRVRGSVRYRTLVTLDADDVPRGEDVWADFRNAFGNVSACVYSTHSHTPRAARLRLVIPLSRPAMPDEYEALSRLVAYNVGMEFFDVSTYQPERLMYWPSMPRDVVPVFEVQDGAPLDVDAVLAEYPGGNWRDVSQWPSARRETLRLSSDIARRKQDPAEAKGAVGAFCRVYDVPAAIAAFLPDVYVPCGENRYTYTGGTTSGGLVLYDGGKFAYSHHATDPACGEACNAYDLVRCHKFGSLDPARDCGDDKRGGKSASTKAMNAFVAADPGVREARVREEFADVVSQAEEEGADTGWLKDFRRSPRGDIKKTPTNIMLILTHAVGMGAFWFDEFSRNICVDGGLPWNTPAFHRYWANADAVNFCAWADESFDVCFVKQMVHDTALSCAQRDMRHPLRDYLLSREWDGVARVDTLLHDYLGADCDDMVRLVTRKWMCAAVRRVLHPGCKFDYCLVLYGAQGIGKSSLFRILSNVTPDEDAFYHDNTIDVGNAKAAGEALQTCWIKEFQEMSDLRGKETETIKAFISGTSDRYRPAYGLVSEQYPRHCVFLATTNSEYFLRGDEGNRRFLPVRCGCAERVSPPFGITPEVRGQIWAEAVRLSSSEPLFFTPEEEGLLAERQEAVNVVRGDERLQKVIDYLNKPLPPQWHTMRDYDRIIYLAEPARQAAEGADVRDFVTSEDVWRECLEGRGVPSPASQREVCALLRRVPGWRQVQKRVGPSVRWGFARIGKEGSDEGE